MKGKAWPEAWSQMVRDGYAASITPTQIAANLSTVFGGIISASAVANRARRLGIEPNWRTDWNDERKAYLAELLASESGSYEAISRKLNYKFGTTFSRNAVIGQANRSGLAGKAPAKSSARYDGEGNLVVREKKTKKQRAERVRLARRALRPIQPPRPTAEVIRLRCAEVTSRNLSFADLEPNDCRYAEGEIVAEFRFCGNSKLKGSSYCSAHHFLCERPREARRNAA